MCYWLIIYYVDLLIFMFFEMLNINVTLVNSCRSLGLQVIGVVTSNQLMISSGQKVYAYFYIMYLICTLKV